MKKLISSFSIIKLKKNLKENSSGKNRKIWTSTKNWFKKLFTKKVINKVNNIPVNSPS